MNYRVEVSEPAENDADAIYAWIKERSQSGAQSWWNAFLAALEKLKSDLSGLALAPETDAFDERLHQLLFKTRRGNVYRILFIVRDAVVHVLRVRGPGQGPISPDEIQRPA